MASEQEETYDDLEFEVEHLDGEQTFSQEMDAQKEEDEFSLIGNEPETPEQRQRYLEYLDLIKEIDCQNQLIETIKNQIIEMCDKPCKTKLEVREIKRLRCCMEKENLHLQCMTSKAMHLQNFGSHRRYGEIPIVTTFDEDNMAPYVTCMPPPGLKGDTSSEVEKSSASCPEKSCASCPESQPSPPKDMNSLCCALANMKVTCPKDKQILRDIARALCCPKPPSKPKQKPCPAKRSSSPCKQHNQQTPCSSSQDSDDMSCPPPCPPPCPKPCPVKNADSLDMYKQKIQQMQCSIKQMKQEMDHRAREKANQAHDCGGEDDEQERLMKCMAKRKTKSEELQKLNDNYFFLLQEYNKKDCQIKELEQRLKGFSGTCGSGGKPQDDSKKDALEAELNLMKVRVSELKEEQNEFKCIMKEQSFQLEDYRTKYLAAQQKVEEQTVTLEKLNMNNKRIEKQINSEIKDIRAKFQEKLNELLHFPKLLENEQLKLAQCCKEKDEMQGKLVLVCKELKALKQANESPKENTDCRPQLAKCQAELAQCQTKLTEVEHERDLYCESMNKLQDDLDTLRSESAKIIARTKERTEVIRQQMQEQISRLEKELAQCRATASLSVKDREAVICEMQGQLNTLSYSFDSAQKQIKTLRNHIAYVSNENCYGVKC